MSDPTPTPLTKKLKRSAHLLYVDSSFDIKTTPSHSWNLVGKDVEDLSVELNPQVETTKNILDETTVEDTGYEPSISVETYYADPSNGALYTKLRDIAMNRLTGGDCRTYVMEVLVDQTGEVQRAWREEAVIKPQSYGGAQGGVRIPYNIHFDGNRTAGTATFSGLTDPDKAKTITPTFTAGS